LRLQDFLKKFPYEEEIDRYKPTEQATLERLVDKTVVDLSNKKLAIPELSDLTYEFWKHIHHSTFVMDVCVKSAFVMNGRPARVASRTKPDFGDPSVDYSFFGSVIGLKTCGVRKNEYPGAIEGYKKVLTSIELAFGQGGKHQME